MVSVSVFLNVAAGYCFLFAVIRDRPIKAIVLSCLLEVYQYQMKLNPGLNFRKEWLGILKEKIECNSLPVHLYMLTQMSKKH